MTTVQFDTSSVNKPYEDGGGRYSKPRQRG
jgi:hypothetical protein